MVILIENIFEELTCIWRGVKNLNKENDHYISSIDHDKDNEFGILQTKGSLYNPEYRRWDFNILKEYVKEFDNLVAYCASQDGKIIEKIFIIPKEEIKKRTIISVYNNISSPTRSWVYRYIVNDEDTLKKVNEIWDHISNIKKNAHVTTGRTKWRKNW